VGAPSSPNSMIRTARGASGSIELILKYYHTGGKKTKPKPKIFIPSKSIKYINLLLDIVYYVKYISINKIEYIYI